MAAKNGAKTSEQDQKSHIHCNCLVSLGPTPNSKPQVQIRVVEHLYRGCSWNITTSSNTFQKTDSQTVEFRIDVAPGQEKVVTYTVHYAW